jgi:zinc transporter ZupT
MGARVRIYLLLAVSMLFLLYGVIGGLVAAFAVRDSHLSAFTLPFTLVGLLGLHLTSVISGLSERIERLERLQAKGSGKPSEPAGVGGGDCT